MWASEFDEGGILGLGLVLVTNGALPRPFSAIACFPELHDVSLDVFARPRYPLVSMTNCAPPIAMTTLGVTRAAKNFGTQLVCRSHVGGGGSACMGGLWSLSMRLANSLSPLVNETCLGVSRLLIDWPYRRCRQAGGCLSLGGGLRIVAAVLDHCEALGGGSMAKGGCGYAPCVMGRNMVGRVHRWTFSPHTMY